MVRSHLHFALGLITNLWLLGLIVLLVLYVCLSAMLLLWFCMPSFKFRKSLEGISQLRGIKSVNQGRGETKRGLKFYKGGKTI